MRSLAQHVHLCIFVRVRKVKNSGSLVDTGRDGSEEGWKGDIFGRRKRCVREEEKATSREKIREMRKREEQE